MNTKNKFLLLLLLPVIFGIFRFWQLVNVSSDVTPTQYWSIRSIDVMKYSRDLAREKLNDRTFDKTIEDQVSRIAGTGATHVALGVPYDSEFLPIMRRWVKTIRKHNLKVWFRGNLSGWEGWFDYKPIDRTTHTAAVSDFILKNADLFEDGDIFSSCPECENGGPGDPRQTGNVDAYRQFLISETDIVRFAMRKIGKDIPEDLHSMNGDVAKLVMDKDTTKRLGGSVVIDHYVATPEQLIKDVKSLGESSGGKIILGEFGAPIPDIHGDMNETQQAQWVQSALLAMSKEPLIVGVNYWTSFGGSTRLWNDDGSARQVVGVISSFFAPLQTKAQVTTWLGIPLSGAQVYLDKFTQTTASNGYFSLPALTNTALEIDREGFMPYKFITLSSQNIYLPPLTWSSFLKYFLFGY